MKLGEASGTCKLSGTAGGVASLEGSTVRSLETRLKPRMFLALRILFAFPFYFSKKYFKQGLWRQGIYGFACSAVIASNRWLKDVKMYEIHLAKKGRNEIADLDRH